jgi:hypothetical protein
VGDEADASCRLDLLVLVVVVVLDDGGAAILVGDLLRGRELVCDLLAIDVVGPVVPATMVVSFGGPLVRLGRAGIGRGSYSLGHGCHLRG